MVRLTTPTTPIEGKDSRGRERDLKFDQNSPHRSLQHRAIRRASPRTSVADDHTSPHGRHHSPCARANRECDARRRAIEPPSWRPRRPCRRRRFAPASRRACRVRAIRASVRSDIIVPGLCVRARARVRRAWRRVRKMNAIRVIRLVKGLGTRRDTATTTNKNYYYYCPRARLERERRAK